MSYFRVPFRVEISNNSVKFQLHKKPFLERKPNHNQNQHQQQHQQQQQQKPTDPLIILLSQLSKIANKSLETNKIEEPKKSKESGHWVFVDVNYTEYKVFVPRGLSLEDTIDRFYPEIVQAQEEELQELQEEEAYESAWDNYERMCYEWD
jgi:hypothetical protein